MINILVILRTDWNACLRSMAISIFLSGRVPFFTYRGSSSNLSSLVLIFAVDLDFFSVNSAVVMRILAFGLTIDISSSPIVLKRVLNIQTLRLRVKKRWLSWWLSRRGIITCRNVKGLVFRGRCLMRAAYLLIYSVFLLVMILFIYLKVRLII